MAESDADRRATGTVSTEEAERLSERFRPSWEDDPPTVPREPLAPRAPAPAPAPVVAVPVASPAAAPPVAERIPTLAGIPAPASTSGRGQASDDLDWEVPTNPVPPAADLPTATPADVAPGPRPPTTPLAAVGTGTAKMPVAAAPVAAEPAPGARTQKLPAITPAAAPSAAATPAAPAPDAAFQVDIDVEELPPESKPSGIGEKYVPKEEGAPPVVLNEDIRVTEAGAQAVRDAQHHARRAPTIAKLKAIELPSTLVSAEPFIPPKKSGAGRVLGVALVLLVAAGGAAALLVRSKPSSESLEPRNAPVAAKIAPDTAAPPPPVLPAETASAATAPAPPAEPPASEAPAASAAPEPTDAPGAEASPEPSTPSKPTKAAGPSPKPAAAPRPTPAPKAGPGAAKPASKPPSAGSKPAGGKAVIVRDTPF